MNINNEMILIMTDINDKILIIILIIIIIIIM